MPNMRGKYIGHIGHLQGQTALLQEAPDGQVLAQFDGYRLTLDGKPMPKRREIEYEPHARFPTAIEVDEDTPPAGALGYGWHRFPASDFEEYIHA